MPPHLPPQNQPIGGNCLENLRPTPGPDDAQAVNRGRCVHLPTRELCGNVPLYANFSLAYETGIITYYQKVPNYLTKDDGEGEWSGAVPALPNAVSRIRVTETEAAELDFRFAICDNTPPEVLSDCCPDIGMSRTIYFKLVVKTGPLGFPPVTIYKTFTNVAAIYDDGTSRWISDPNDPNAATADGNILFAMGCGNPSPGSFGLRLFFAYTVTPSPVYPTDYIGGGDDFYAAGVHLYECDPLFSAQKLLNPATPLNGPFDGTTPPPGEIWFWYVSFSGTPF